MLIASTSSLRTRKVAVIMLRRPQKADVICADNAPVSRTGQPTVAAAALINSAPLCFLKQGFALGYTRQGFALRYTRFIPLFTFLKTPICVYLLFLVDLSPERRRICGKN